MPGEIKKSIGKVAIVPRGKWSATAVYDRLDIVTLDGSTYMALQEHQNRPVTDSDFWMVIAQKGTDGEDGTDATPEMVSSWLQNNIRYESCAFFHDYDPNASYVQGDVILHEGKLYRCLDTTTFGAWNPEYWELIKLAAVIDSTLTIEGAAADAKAVRNAINEIARQGGGGSGGSSGSGLTIDQIYPPGSVYISTISTNPAVIFGTGTWVPIQGKFLIGADEQYPVGEEGGSSEVTLTEEELPEHTHKTVIKSTWATAEKNNAEYHKYLNSQYNTDGGTSWTSEKAGKGKSFSIIPPYFSVYMWYREE